MAGEGHGSGAAQQSAATSAGERSMAGGSGAAQQSAAATPSAAAGDRSMPGEEHSSGAAQQSAAATPCRAALAISSTWLIKVQVNSAHSAYVCSVLTLPALAHVRSFDQRVLELESVGRAH